MDVYCDRITDVLYKVRGENPRLSPMKPTPGSQATPQEQTDSQTFENHQSWICGALFQLHSR